VLAITPAKMNWNRILSLLLAALYVVIAYHFEGAKGAWEVVLSAILPLAAIWYSDAMGGYTGPTTGMPITAPSPGVLVCFLGWALLLMPIVIGIVIVITGAKS
jgi:hypothetical protein